jgi:hypothetical protein
MKTIWLTRHLGIEAWADPADWGLAIALRFGRPAVMGLQFGPFYATVFLFPRKDWTGFGRPAPCR